MNLVISDEILAATRMSESELKQEIAVMLFYSLWVRTKKRD